MHTKIIITPMQALMCLLLYSILANPPENSNGRVTFHILITSYSTVTYIMSNITVKTSLFIKSLLVSLRRIVVYQHIVSQA